MERFLSILEQTANRWSSGIFVLTKTILALFSLFAAISFIVVSTTWFMSVFGFATFVLALVISSFVISVFSTMAKTKDNG
jgi:hypothetical protein